jgi:hypothetical protein
VTDTSTLWEESPRAVCAPRVVFVSVIVGRFVEWLDVRPIARAIALWIADSHLSTATDNGAPGTGSPRL